MSVDGKKANVSEYPAPPLDYSFKEVGAVKEMEQKVDEVRSDRPFYSSLVCRSRTGKVKQRQMHLSFAGVVHLMLRLRFPLRAARALDRDHAATALARRKFAEEGRREGQEKGRTILGRSNPTVVLLLSSLHLIATVM
jgi:hypothetical protein